MREGREKEASKVKQTTRQYKWLKIQPSQLSCCFGGSVADSVCPRQLQALSGKHCFFMKSVWFGCDTLFSTLMKWHISLCHQGQFSRSRALSRSINITPSSHSAAPVHSPHHHGSHSLLNGYVDDKESKHIRSDEGELHNTKQAPI